MRTANLMPLLTAGAVSPRPSAARWAGGCRRSALWGLTALLFCASLLWAQTEEKIFNSLYTHGFFTDKNWYNTGDTINYDLALELLSFDLQSLRFAGGDADNVAAFTTVAGDLYLMRVTAEPPRNAFDQWDLLASHAVASPVTPGSGLFTVIASADNRLDTIFLISADSTSAARLYADRIRTADFSSTGRTEITLTPPNPNCRLAVIQGGPRHSGDAEAGIWIGGSHGLLRFFGWNGTGWTESSFDLSATETITSIHPHAVASASGRIYQRQAESFVQSARPCSSAIRQISLRGAVGDQGVVIRKVGQSWKRFTVGSADYRFASFSPASAGARVELIDADWKYSTALLQDSLTTFTVSPDSVAAYINHGRYEYTSDRPETLLVSLHDPDGNCHLPTMTLSDYLSTRDLAVGTSGDTLRDMHPDSMPGVGTPPYSELADTTLILVLSPSRVTLLAPTRMRQFSTGRGYYWIDSTFTNGVSWSQNNDIVIDLAGNTLTIRNKTQSTVLIENRPPTSALVKAVTVRPQSHGLLFRFCPGQLTAIRVFSPLGRLLAETTVSQHADFVSVPLQASSGLLCIEYLLADGSARRQTVPFSH